MGVSEGATEASGTALGRSTDGVLEISDLAGDLAAAILQETRLHLLVVLSSDTAINRGGYTLQELAALLGCSPQNVHHHLRILSDAGAARLVHVEGTDRIPRQHWCSDVRTVRLRAPEGGPDASLAIEMPGPGRTAHDGV